MEVSENSFKLKIAPFQLVEIPEGVILKRGCTELKIIGEGAAAAVHRVLSNLIANPTTYEEILKKFSIPTQPIVKDLIDKLVTKNFLFSDELGRPITEGPESHLDLFYWHFATSTKKINQRINQGSLTIFGVNYISRQLTFSLMTSGIHNIQVVDHPLLRNLRMFDEGGNLRSEEWLHHLPPPSSLQEWNGKPKSQVFTCLVATSDFGDQQTLAELNRFCVENKQHFLPLVLKNVVGYFGPLVIPGETACFECFRARENSHINEPLVHQAIANAAFEGQLVNGFHPSMAFMLGDLAAFELTKFYSDALPNWNVGTLVELNLLASRMSTRKVLKVPRCKVCSYLHSTSSTTSRAQSVNPEKWNSL